MLLGVSDAVVTGAAAVMGALVGATAGGMLDLFLEVRREKARAKAGARILAGDIAIADGRFKSIEIDHKWWIFFDLSMQSWDEYRDVLAIYLDGAEFEVVSQAVVGARFLAEKIPAAPIAKHAGSYLRLNTQSVAAFKAIRADAAKAYNALAKLAGHQPVNGTIHGLASEEERAAARADDERRGSDPAPS